MIDSDKFITDDYWQLINYNYDQIRHAELKIQHEQCEWYLLPYETQNGALKMEIAREQ